MSNPPESVSQLLDISASTSAEFLSKKHRLDRLIGEKHWVSVGAYKESLLRRHLSNLLPRRFEVSTGFVVSSSSNDKRVSKQLDVLIWDSINYAPFFRDGEFAIIPPEALRAAIEVKGTASTKHLKDALKNLDSLSVFRDDLRPNTGWYSSVFCYKPHNQFSMPVSALNTTINFYRAKSKVPLDRRIASLSKAMNQSHRDSGWINSIILLTGGVVESQFWKVDDQYDVAYCHFRPSHENQPDALGFLERKLLLHLLKGAEFGPHHEHPGYSGLLRSDSELCLKYSLVDFRGTITSINRIGCLKTKTVDKLKARFHSVKATK